MKSLAEVFTAVKLTLIDALCLAHPMSGKPLSLAVNASATHVGACLKKQDTWFACVAAIGIFLQ
jgi:hypothetical protein